MCSRYTLSKEDLKTALKRVGVKLKAEPASRYNIAPGTKISAVRRSLRPQESGEMEACELRWGLVPSWSKSEEAGAGLANARAESLALKPSFKDAFRRRRCLIPASGFYEWKVSGRARLPWLFQLKDAEPFFLAGLWETWIGPAAETIESCTIITTEPNRLMQPIHQRMPAILPVEIASEWVDPSATTDSLHRLLDVFPMEKMQARPVSSRVNSAANDDEACLLPAEVVPGEQQELGF